MVAQCDLRAQQIGAAHIAASQILSVTHLAVDSIKSLAMGYYCRIDRSPLLSRNESTDALLLYCSRRRRLLGQGRVHGAH
jgi:hypothetical protein